MTIEEMKQRIEENNAIACKHAKRLLTAAYIVNAVINNGTCGSRKDDIAREYLGFAMYTVDHVSQDFGETDTAFLQFMEKITKICIEASHDPETVEKIKQLKEKMKGVDDEIEEYIRKLGLEENFNTVTKAMESAFSGMAEEFNS